MIIAIYGDEISEDPYEPQEIHISLGDDSTFMNVMFITMENLEKPFVEYYLAKDDNDIFNTNNNNKHQIKSAINYTYEVPQKW